MTTAVKTPIPDVPFALDASRRGAVLLPPTDTFQLYLIGTGGTGSHLALALARLAWHAKQFNKTATLTFVDPDRVEEKNIGRQLFCPAEVGQYKAETLAMRFNAAFGLDIQAVPTALTLKTLEPESGYPGPGYRHNSLVIGAVDNHLARRVMAEVAARHRCWWLDMGNEQVSGRLYIGNLADRALLPSLEINEFGICPGLPFPSLQDPDLLEPPAVDAPQLSCADLTAHEAQSLMVNQMIAALAAQYVADFVLARRLTTFKTVFTLEPPAVHSETITDTTLAALRAEVNDAVTGRSANAENRGG